MHRLLILSVVTIGLLGGYSVQAEDTIDQPVVRMSLFSDVKALKIGDTLTVVISESNSATKNATTATTKQNKIDASGTVGSGALSGLIPGLSGSQDISGQFDGSGSTTRSGQFTSRMTVVVKAIDPNGNLVVEGHKTMEINEDLETVTLSGTVRPQDIDSTNTISSYQVANIILTYKGTGSVSQAHRPGLITRIFNWIL